MISYSIIYINLLINGHRVSIMLILIKFNILKLEINNIIFPPNIVLTSTPYFITEIALSQLYTFSEHYQ